MKLISYDPQEIKNVPAFMNKCIDEYSDERFFMFIFDSVIKYVIDKEELVHKYEELLTKLDLPYAFFPYYAHFNKILPNNLGKPSPRISAKLKDGFAFDIVQEPTFGMLVLDMEKLKKINFRFNEEYKMSFYIQDLIKKCLDNNLYFSEAYFIDVHESHKLFNFNFNNVFIYDRNKFVEEKQKYYNENKDHTSEQINDYVNNLKEKYGVKEAPAEEKAEAINSVNEEQTSEVKTEEEKA